jgi:hypothetical protein
LSGITSLDVGEQAFFGSQEYARAIDIDAAAFEDQVGFEAAELKPGGELSGYRVITLPVIVFGPAVEDPIGDSDFAGAFDENGAEVPGPTAIGGNLEEFNGARIDSGFLENT